MGLCAEPLLAFPERADANSDSCSSRLCCDACIGSFGAAREQEQLGGRVRPFNREKLHTPPPSGWRHRLDHQKSLQEFVGAHISDISYYKACKY